jgi:hypothetical protein
MPEWFWSTVLVLLGFVWAIGVTVEREQSKSVAA